jgi:hypothetical protein
MSDARETDVVPLTSDECDRLIIAIFEPDDDCAHNLTPLYVEVARLVAAARADEREQIRSRIAAGPSCGVASREHDGCYVQDALRATYPPEQSRPADTCICDPGGVCDGVRGESDTCGPCLALPLEQMCLNDPGRDPAAQAETQRQLDEAVAALWPTNQAACGEQP